MQLTIELVESLRDYYDSAEVLEWLEASAADWAARPEEATLPDEATEATRKC